MPNWLTLHQNLPIKMRRYLKKRVGELSDFIFHYKTSDCVVFSSPSTKIEVSISFDEYGIALAIWFPDAEDPTYTEHQISIKNPFFNLISI
jgi:hypothetical protein